MNDIINYSTDCLKLLSDKFKERNIFHWIDFGTLLSAYRDGEMFDHDYDVDICIFKETKSDVIQILNELINENRLSIMFGTEGNIIMIEFFGHDIKSRRFDIYICERNGNFIGMLHYNGNFKFKSFYIDELETIKLGDYEFNCPRHLSSFLKLRYGKDYMIPQYRCEELNKEWWEITDNVGVDKRYHIVYTSLVGDLFHEGHYNLLKRCKKLFQKVIVGVHNDEQVMSYKEKPLDSYEVRLENVKKTGLFDEIYENAPAITTQSFIDDLEVDFVVAGRESSEKIKQMYPVDINRLHLISRTEGISTSILKSKFQ